MAAPCRRPAAPRIRHVVRLAARLVDAGHGLDQPLAPDLAQVLLAARARPWRRGRSRARCRAAASRPTRGRRGRSRTGWWAWSAATSCTAAAQVAGLTDALVLAPHGQRGVVDVRPRAPASRTVATAGPALGRLGQLVEADPADEVGVVRQRQGDVVLARPRLPVLLSQEVGDRHALMSFDFGGCAAWEAGRSIVSTSLHPLRRARLRCSCYGAWTGRCPGHIIAALAETRAATRVCGA